MSQHVGKHFPVADGLSRPYWDGCREHRLMIQRCSACGVHQFYPRIMCSACLADSPEWVQASGRGHIRSFTVARHPVSSAYAAETPYVVALIKLDEGPTMMSNIVECDIDALEIGQPVEVLFEDWSDEITVPKFRPSRG